MDQYSGPLILHQRLSHIQQVPSLSLEMIMPIFPTSYKSWWFGFTPERISGKPRAQGIRFKETTNHAREPPGI